MLSVINYFHIFAEVMDTKCHLTKKQNDRNRILKCFQPVEAYYSQCFFLMQLYLIHQNCYQNRCIHFLLLIIKNI